MRKVPEPRQFSKPLGGGAVWIYGDMDTPVEGPKGPLVMGRGWMLEMVRFDKHNHTIGLFLASYGIVDFNIPEFREKGRADFVGISIPGEPPAEWLHDSIVIDLGKTPLAKSPKDLLAQFKTRLPHTCIDAAVGASALSCAAQRRIAETYKDDVPISEVARELGVSHAHLTRQFKRDFGFPPLNYRHRLRVSDATGRLFQGDDILDVAYDVGFNDTSRFYQGFRKITGVPPGKCRP